MRVQELVFDCNGKLAVDIMELPDIFVIVVSNGKAMFAEIPAFAETKIVI